MASSPEPTDPRVNDCPVCGPDDDCDPERRREALAERLNFMNECVRTYVHHRDRGYELRPGWLEEEIDATDQALAVFRASRQDPQ